MSQKFCIDVRGKRKEWVFIFDGDVKYLNEWLEDGLHIDMLVNTIPQWYVDLGLPVKLWCAVQDFFTGGEPK